MINKELLELNDKYIKLKKANKTTIIISVIIGILCFIGFIGFATQNKIKISLIPLSLIIVSIIVCIVINYKCKETYDTLYNDLESSILRELELKNWKYTKSYDVSAPLKSKQGLDKYDDIKFFKEYDYMLSQVDEELKAKKNYSDKINKFLKKNYYKEIELYPLIEAKIKRNLVNTKNYVVLAFYKSPAGRVYLEKKIYIDSSRVDELIQDKSLLMSKSEYSKHLREHEKELLEKKQKEFYDRVNNIIDLGDECRDILIIKDDDSKMDKLIYDLFDRTVNSIKKIKNINSEEWKLIDNIINNIETDVNEIINNNKRIIEYYGSPDFQTIKNTCEKLMSTQIEFNDYIKEKVKSISSLFGTSIVRDETIIEDDFNYIHPYKKRINPFVAEVSTSVFASAENNPLDYVVKYFYPDKARYPEQIEKLHLLIEELETLKDAKNIIDNYKESVNEYISNVPSYIMDNDKDGFYSRLGFAIIDESSLVIQYWFSYTSNGGHAQRSFPIPMTEETIISLIHALESKLTITAFSKQQRALMTAKLRKAILERDSYTCKCCGNSKNVEPNLLLEVDHILPVSKGGVTEENNLQTLCWKCNRQKSNKIIS